MPPGLPLSSGSRSCGSFSPSSRVFFSSLAAGFGSSDFASGLCCRFALRLPSGLASGLCCRLALRLRSFLLCLLERGLDVLEEPFLGFFFLSLLERGLDVLEEPFLGFFFFSFLVVVLRGLQPELEERERPLLFFFFLSFLAAFRALLLQLDERMPRLPFFFFLSFFTTVLRGLLLDERARSLLSSLGLARLVFLAFLPRDWSSLSLLESPFFFLKLFRLGLRFGRRAAVF